MGENRGGGGERNRKTWIKYEEGKGKKKNGTKARKSVNQ